MKNEFPDSVFLSINRQSKRKCSLDREKIDSMKTEMNKDQLRIIRNEHERRHQKYLSRTNN